MAQALLKGAARAMEFFPPELREAPKVLVGLVGEPHLHAEVADAVRRQPRGPRKE